jgi:hypothetical protein
MRKVLSLAWVAAAMLLPAARLSAETPADQAAAQQIGQRLKESGRLRNYRIGVKYEEGVAWLNGSVANPAQREEALRLTQEMPGVAHVINRLEVASPQAASGANMPTNYTEEYSAQPSPNQRSAPSQFGAASQRMASASSQSQRFANNMPVPAGRMAAMPMQAGGGGMPGYDAPPQNAVANAAMGMAPMPAAHVPGGARAASYDNAQMPGYAWPSYASYPNYAALSYPQQYSPTAWPYIGPFYPYPQVPLAWRKVSLEWDDGWWFLDFKDQRD